MMASRRNRIKAPAKIPGLTAPAMPDRPKTPSIVASVAPSTPVVNFTENSCPSSPAQSLELPSPATPMLPPPSPLVFSAPATPKSPMKLPVAHKSLPIDEEIKAAKRPRQRSKGPLPDPKDMTMRHFALYNPPKKAAEKTESENIPAEAPRLPSPPKQPPIVSRKMSTDSVASVSSAADSTTSSVASAPSTSVGPRVKVGKDGKLILDEQSLVVETSEAERAKQQLEQMETVSGAKYAIGSSGLYSRKKGVKRGSDWDQEETMKFYRALNACGTDFSMMATIFKGTRTRAELKAKYKREDKRNPQQVNRALSTQYFDPVAALSDSEDDDRASTSATPTTGGAVEVEIVNSAIQQPDKIFTSKIRTRKSSREQSIFQKPNGKVDWNVYDVIKGQTS